MEDSLFLTLCARALDNRSQHPILGDVTADEIVRTLDYDYGRFNINTNLMINVALRAKKLRGGVGIRCPPPGRGRD
jgi:O-methyltransferase involved in polyketide biosynthesis